MSDRGLPRAEDPLVPPSGSSTLAERLQRGFPAERGQTSPRAGTRAARVRAGKWATEGHRRSGRVCSAPRGDARRAPQPPAALILPANSARDARGAAARGTSPAQRARCCATALPPPPRSPAPLSPYRAPYRAPLQASPQAPPKNSESGVNR